MKKQIGLAFVLVVAVICAHELQLAAEPQRAVPLERWTAHHTVWEGRYLCAQGETALKLTLETAPDGETVGTFSFGPHAGNPRVPSGSYRVRGQITMRDGGAFDLTLLPVRWIVQPAGYVMVGLTATSNRERTELNGRIAYEACDWVRVARVN